LQRLYLQVEILAADKLVENIASPFWTGVQFPSAPPRKKHHAENGVFFLEELGVAPGKGVGETGVSPLRKTLKTEGFLERC